MVVTAGSELLSLGESLDTFEARDLSLADGELCGEVQHYCGQCPRTRSAESAGPP
jgi:hypothetical protein